MCKIFLFVQYLNLYKNTTKIMMCQSKFVRCHLRIKSALFFDDLKFKSALTQNDKKDVI